MSRKVEVFGGDAVGRKARTRYERIAAKLEAREDLTDIELAYAVHALRRYAARIPDRSARRGNPGMKAKVDGLAVVDEWLGGSTREQIAEKLHINVRTVGRVLAELTTRSSKKKRAK